MAVCLALICMHRAMVAVKYASLTRSEFLRLFSASFEQAESWQGQLQVLSGWMVPPNGVATAAELLLSAKRNGIHIQAVHMDTRLEEANIGPYHVALRRASMAHAAATTPQEASPYPPAKGGGVHTTSTAPTRVSSAASVAPEPTPYGGLGGGEPDAEAFFASASVGTVLLHEDTLMVAPDTRPPHVPDDDLDKASFLASLFGARKRRGSAATGGAADLSLANTPSPRSLAPRACQGWLGSDSVDGLRSALLARQTALNHTAWCGEGGRGGGGAHCYGCAAI